MVLYAAGMALNDLFDLEIDRAERPARPLPSGRVSPAFAAWIGGAGWCWGRSSPGSAARSQPGRGRWYSRVAILAYDAGTEAIDPRARSSWGPAGA